MTGRSGPIQRSLAFVWSVDRVRTVGVVALSVLAGAAPVVITWLTKLLVDAVAAGEGLSRVVPVTVVFLLTTLAAQVVPAVSELVFADLGRRVHLAASDRAFARLNDLGGIRHFESPQFQDRIDIGLAGSEAPVAIVRSATGIVHGVVTLVGFFVALASIDWRAAVLVLATALPHFRTEMRLARERFQVGVLMTPVERLTFLYRTIQTQANAAKELRLFGLGEFFKGRMLAEMATAQAAAARLDRRSLRVRTGMDGLALLPIAAALALAAYQIRQGSITPGDIVLYLAAVQAATTATQGLAMTTAMLAQDTLSANAFFEILDTEPDIRRRVGDPTPPLDRLELRGIWFRYRPDLPWVLRGVDLDLPAGGSLAIVGVNGAGKSTLVKLLCRLYDPERGSIRWNGTDIRDLDVDGYRSRIGAVFQDFVSYDLTVRENVALGDVAGANEARIRDAIAEVGLSDAVEQLPRGLDTRLSRLFADVPDDDEEGTAEGSYLSGGQWQRLAIARMLLRADRDLLILDEPSSGLDPRAEFELNATVHERAQGRARVLVSHRLNAVRSADRIVVLDGGVITESGDHGRLMAAKGTYAALFELQRRGYET